MRQLFNLIIVKMVYWKTRCCNIFYKKNEIAHTPYCGPIILHQISIVEHTFVMKTFQYDSLSGKTMGDRSVKSILSFLAPSS